MKPNYLYLFKTDKAIEDILQHPPFTYDDIVNSKISKNEAFFEFKHFDLKCHRIQGENISVRGIKTWQILVEDILYDELSDDYIQDVLQPMMCTYALLGGRVIKLYKYNQI
jgi:hypothetical protein